MERLTTRIAMRLMTGDERSRDLDVAWSYRPSDPYAIDLDFSDCQADTVWTISRDLLTAGLHTPVGEGDVHVAPYGDTRLLIALAGQEGVALLAAPAEEVDRFVNATAELVPAGSEHTRIDWGGGLEELLAS
ncbi:SsgA family sporulation/cell division regulator [Streptomyces sp. NRRL S-350]|uniref:SsgA family sporulation/cell division regulator n=1 Tax=Streptomyces sp. NRRL S-350 TaxID=1463902 RepID=UPI00068C6883|nr:SsgA family sporulation/cell division regulator [Streptomyces sp. NRRL S-350]